MALPPVDDVSSLTPGDAAPGVKRPPPEDGPPNDGCKRFRTRKGASAQEEQEEAKQQETSMTCPHSIINASDRCFKCGQQLVLPNPMEDLVDGRLLPFNYVEEGLRIRAGHLKGIRRSKTINMLTRERLFLVLDLDHTILHSRSIQDVDAGVVQDPGRGLYEMGIIGCFTKLRPYAKEFIAKMSTLFNIYIYTMGGREYSRRMATLLDPNGGRYFHEKVICREDGSVAGKKDLDVVLADPYAVVTLDDTPSVWTPNSGNLVHIDRFFFSPFKDPNQKGRAGEGEDDCFACNSRLVHTTSILQRIHREYFDDLKSGAFGLVDVRKVIIDIRSRTLRGCYLVFSYGQDGVGIVNRLWGMASLLGAVCFKGVSPAVTHVISCGLEWTGESQWASMNGRFLVTKKWLMEAYFSWRRPEEEKYSLPSLFF